MELSTKYLEQKNEWREANYQLPQYDRKIMISKTLENPYWIHFGAGNIFRAFQANAVQNLLNNQILDRGLIVVEGFDEEIIHKIYTPHDNLSILVTLKANGSIEKKIIGSIANSYVLDSQSYQFTKLKEFLKKDSLQILSFTITEKGYSLTDMHGNYFDSVLYDFNHGYQQPISYIGKICSLLYERYLSAQKTYCSCKHG